MNEININIDEFQGKRVLITPLNWGLGHATRCIPIISLFLNADIQVAIASDGEALAMLKRTFPTIQSFHLPAYNIKYPYKSMELNMFLQAPKFLQAVLQENKSIAKIILDWDVDIIISDNRFGCRSSHCLSIFMTHQVQLVGANRLSTWIANKINQSIIHQFDRLWIPDYKGKQSLAGKLSKSENLFNSSIKIEYINALSRFKIENQANVRDVLIVLSGPEPTRSKLEKRLTSVFQNTTLNVLFVRGTNHIHNYKTKLPSVNLLDSKQLNKEILSSKLIICRSGYTSIMDLDKLNKQAILIPTIGQSEQEYLADFHQSKSIFNIWRTNERSEQLIELVHHVLQ